MNTARRRPLSLNNLRAFEAVARLASFSAAADELFLTQSAVSRQIKSLEDELGAALFSRGTRHVEPTPDAQLLLRSVEPWLARLDAGVRQIREQRTRRRVNVHTFASFASLWLLPRIEAFQRQHPDIDIRVSAHDAMSDLDDPEVDLILRYCSPAQAPAGAVRLFGETLTPAVSRQLMERIRAGEAPAMTRPADLARHTLAEEDDHRASAEYLSWRHWLAQHGEPTLQPRRWLYLNFTYQQVQAALSGQAIALARLALVSESLQRRELMEPFGPSARIDAPSSYWLLMSRQGRQRPEAMEFARWVQEQAALTRLAIGDGSTSDAEEGLGGD